LTEAIVVACIIGLLLVMLLPAVNRSREAARNTSCKNNLHQIVSAVQSYESQKQALPALYNGIFLPQPRTALDEFHFHSWRAAILNEIEETAVLGVLDTTVPATDMKNQLAINTRIPTFLCPSTNNTHSNVPDIQPFDPNTYPFNIPSQPVVSAQTAARSDYEVVGGVQIAPMTTSSGDLSIIRFGAWGEPTYRNNTGFSLRYRKARLSQVSDGLSHTILVGERAGRPDLFRSGEPEDPYPYRDPTRGMDHHQAAWAISTHFWWLVSWHEQSVNETNGTGIFGFHPGGANIALADGSVRFLADATSSALLTALITRSGSESVALE
jgi:prepilin-type processing-associated H-X9-DG protein